MSIEHHPAEFRILGPDETVGRTIGCVVFAPILDDYGLTPAEVRELVGASYGLTTPEYALEEDLSPHTSKSRRKYIRGKTQSITIAEAIVKSFLTGDLDFTLESGIHRPRLSPILLRQLALVATGCTNAEIAKSGHKSIETVKNQVTTTLVKLEAANRYHAMRRSFETGVFRISGSEFEP